MAELTPAERREQRIAAAKRRAAEKRGETYVPEGTEAPVTPSATASHDQVHAVEAVTSPAAEAQIPAAAVHTTDTAGAEPARPDPVDEASGAAEVLAAAPAARGPERATPAPAVQRATAAPGTHDAGEEAKFPRTDIRTLNRREFLTYSWGAAIGIVSVQSLVATGLLMYPRFREGEFGGDFPLGSVAGLPSTEAAPQGDPIGKFWLVNTEEGPRALYMVCTHLGCLYKWVEANRRFECPCHGSKFTREGEYIEGPAPRGLDQFVVELQDNGAVVGSTEEADGQVRPPALVSDGLNIVIKTGSKIQGKPHS